MPEFAVPEVGTVENLPTGHVVDASFPSPAMPSASELARAAMRRLVEAERQKERERCCESAQVAGDAQEDAIEPCTIHADPLSSVLVQLPTPSRLPTADVHHGALPSNRSAIVSRAGHTSHPGQSSRCSSRPSSPASARKATP